MKIILLIACLFVASCSEGPLWEREGGTLNLFYYTNKLKSDNTLKCDYCNKLKL